MDDPDAGEFDEFYLNSRDRVLLHVAALTADPARAAALVQEAYVLAWARWTYVGGLADPETWVRRAAHRRAAGRWRRAVPHPARGTPSVEWDAGQQAVLDALRALPCREREAVVLRFVVGLSLDRVAAELRVPLATAEAWLAAGNRKLTAALAASTPSEEVRR